MVTLFACCLMELGSGISSITFTMFILNDSVARSFFVKTVHVKVTVIL
jgi:hypothetical protein